MHTQRVKPKTIWTSNTKYVNKYKWHINPKRTISKTDRIDSYRENTIARLLISYYIFDLIFLLLKSIYNSRMTSKRTVFKDISKIKVANN